MYSKIILTFNTDLAINQTFGWTAYSVSPFINNDIVFRMVSTRLGIGQITVGTPTATAGERTAINFVIAFNADWNASGNYLVSRVDNVVTIQSNVPSIYYSDTFSYDVFGEEPPTTNTDVTFSNVPFAGTVMSITELEFQEATTNPACTHYKVSVTTSALATSIQYPSPADDYVSNASNPFTFELLRGQSFKLNCKAADDQIASTSRSTFQVPQVLSSGNFEVIVTNSLSGATVVVNALTDVSNLVLEYSLNGTDWQSENIFSGLLADDYTLYVRDQLGCSFTTDFTVDEYGSVRIPYFLMPKSNSIRFANRVTWSDCSNYKTDENTLSCEANVKVPYKQILLFQSCDVITTQFRSNYVSNTATVIKEDGTEVSVPVIQATNNMDQKDRRDARKYNLGDGKTGIYFITGNIYDFDTGADTGEDYTLNGLLPDFAIVGTQIKIDSEWFVIEDIIFDESVNAFVLVVTNTYEGADTLVDVSIVYDLENFEEYEFTIDFVDYLNQKLQVRVDATDDTFDDIQQLSEVIEVKVRHENTDEFTYKNTTNTANMNYSRGLEHKIRLLVEKVEGVIFDETKSDKSDTTAVLLESQVDEGDRIVFSPMTKQMMQLVCRAISHDTLTRNGVSYVKNASVEVEGPLEDTNLYDVVVTLIKANSTFNSNVSQGSNTINSSDSELPGLIETDSGYVSYL